MPRIIPLRLAAVCVLALSLTFAFTALAAAKGPLAETGKPVREMASAKLSFAGGAAVAEGSAVPLKNAASTTNGKQRGMGRGK